MDSTENMYISDLDNKNSYWIGYYNFIHNNDDESQYRWTNLYKQSFEDVGYRNWNDSIFNKHNNDLSYDCVYYDSISSTWYDDNCQNDDEHYIICDNPFDYQFDTNGYYSNRYVFAPSINTQENSQDQFWYEGRISCLLFYNTYLATIENFDDNEEAMSLTPNSFFFGYLNDNDVPYHFGWDNKQIGAYSDWAEGEPNGRPNNLQNGDAFVAYFSETGEWYDENVYNQERLGLCDSAHADNEYFVDSNASYIVIHTCSNWNDMLDLELSDTMHIVIKDKNGYSTDYITINADSGLAPPGYWKTFSIENNTQLLNLMMINDGDSFWDGYSIYSISIGMSSSNILYCIDGFMAVINGESYVLNDQLSNGAILSDNCEENNFYYNYDSQLLLNCHEGLYTMYTSYNSDITKNMYQVSLTTCNVNDGGINDMLLSDGSLSLSIIGKNSAANTLVTSDSTTLNHVAMTGNIDWSNVGTLLASDMEIFADGRNTLCTVDRSGILLGIKIVVSRNDPNYGKPVSFWAFDEWNFSIDNCRISKNCSDSSQTTTMFSNDESNERIVVYSVWGNTRGGGSFNLFTDSWTGLVDDTDYTLSIGDTISMYFGNSTRSMNDIGSSSNSSIMVHVYGIFEEEIDNYDLPYYFVDNNNLTWLEADENCMSTYGTHLASIHSLDEMMAAVLVSKSTASWIGLTDGYNEAGTDGSAFEWNDYSGLNYQYWDEENGEPSDYNIYGEQEDCVVIGNKYWHSVVCSNKYYSLCSKSKWSPNTKKTFNIPISSEGFGINDIIMVSISNSDTNDAICIDSISVNDENVPFIENKWIGDSNSGECSDSGKECVALGFEFLKLAVCSVEVVGIQLLLDEIEVYESSSSINGLTCNNYNRLESTTCQVSQEFSFDTYTDVEFSVEQTYSTSISTSKTESTSIAHESLSTFDKMFVTSQTTTAGLAGDPLLISILADEPGGGDIAVIDRIQAALSSAESFSLTTANDKMAIDTSVTNTIGCNGNIDVTPSTSISYDFTFSKIEAIIPVYIDLKLTMCDDYYSQDGKIQYLSNIVGEIGIDTTNYCDVTFNEATILSNKMLCYQELELSFLSQDKVRYVPVCNSTHPEYYDGCQCSGLNEYGDATMCMCVDKYGEPLSDGKGILHENDDWRDTCRELSCDGSIYQSSSGTGGTGTGTGITISSSDNDSSSDLIIIVLVNIASIACCCCICVVVLGIVFFKYVNKNNNKSKEQENLDKFLKYLQAQNANENGNENENNYKENDVNQETQIILSGDNENINDIGKTADVLTPAISSSNII